MINNHLRHPHHVNISKKRVCFLTVLINNRKMSLQLYLDSSEQSVPHIYLTYVTPPSSGSVASSPFSTPILMPPAPLPQSCLVTFRIRSSESSITYAVPILPRPNNAIDQTKESDKEPK